jgi:hypothetical protein
VTSIEVRLSRAVTRITASSLGSYQTAVIRIGFSLTWLLFLLREFPNRQELYGPDGPWSWSMARTLIEDNGAFTALMWSDSQAWFEIIYALAIISSVLLLLGWHTRTMSVLFMVGVLSLENRSIFMSDGGDNVIHLMAIYLVLTRCGAVWSLDARRARLGRAAPARGARLRADAVGPLLWGVLGLALLVVTGKGYLSPGWMLIYWGLWAVHGLWWVVDRRASRAGARESGSRADAYHDGAPQPDSTRGDVSRNEPRLLLDVIANLTHNAGLLVIMAEACLIYATAGWYKIQGSRWEDGTAVYYPLHLDYFSPWPALSNLLGEHGLVVLVITYGTVIIQVAFPFTLFNRRVKNVLLVAMMCEHTVIAVTLGLPFFSLAMIAADSVFLPTSFLLRLATLAARAHDAVLSRARRALPGSHGAWADGSHTGEEPGHASKAPEAPEIPEAPEAGTPFSTADSRP